MLKFLLKLPFLMLLFKRGRRALFTAFTVTVLLVLFHNLGPRRFVLSAYQEQMLEDLVEKAVSRFPWSAETGRVMMISDSEIWPPRVTDAIRAKVMDYKSDGSRKFDVIQETFADRFLKTLGFETTRQPLSESQIEKLRSNMPADTLLLVRFGSGDYKETETSVIGRLECRFYRKNGKTPNVITVTSAIDKRKDKALSLMEHELQTTPMPRRFIVAVACVLVFPFIVSPLTLLVVRRRRAQANAVMIGVYAIANFAIISLFIGLPTEWPQSILLCLAYAAVLLYLLFTCDLIASPSFKKRLQRPNALY